MIGDHFASQAAADRYAAGRPDYGPHLADVLRELLPPDPRLDVGVDVGCGTGISTTPLLAVARWVVGVDPSLAMLAHTEPSSRTAFVAGVAERLPLAASCADLVAVGSAFHWLDRDRFVAEAARVTHDDAWLVVHQHWFPGRLEGRADFTDWVRDVYLDRYPSPSRRPRLTAGEDLGAFAHITTEEYTHTLTMTRPELITYLVTQSNIGAVVDAGDEDLEGVVAWLDDELAPLLSDGATGAVLFGGRVHLLRRV